MSRVLATPTQPLSYLAFDFGVRRVGVASGNSLTRTATPLTTVAAEGEARLAAIAALIDEWRPRLVVGVPRHPTARGTPTPSGRRFGRELRRASACRHEVDERHTTTEAKRTGS